MLAEKIAGAIAAAGTARALDAIGRVLWRGLAERHLDDDAAGQLSEALEARRAALRTSETAKPRRAPTARVRPVQRSPDRARSIERRRRLAAAGPLPPALAAKFTTGELAVLAVIRLEVEQKGFCALPIDAVAAIAGTSRTVVKGALKSAAGLGLVHVRERRLSAWRNLPNLVTIVSVEWRAWIKLRGGRGRISDQHDQRSTSKKQAGTPSSSGQGLQEASKGRMGAIASQVLPSQRLPAAKACK